MTSKQMCACAARSENSIPLTGGTTAVSVVMSSVADVRTRHARHGTHPQIDQSLCASAAQRCGQRRTRAKAFTRPRRQWRHPRLTLHSVMRGRTFLFVFFNWITLRNMSHMPTCVSFQACTCITHFRCLVVPSIESLISHLHATFVL